jgi:plasmid stabilization system protein ParE
MAYLVEFSARAIRDLEALYAEKNVAESQAAARWYNELEEAVEGLKWRPHRCPLVPETRRLKRKLRQLLDGKNAHIYRVSTNSIRIGK